MARSREDNFCCIIFFFVDIMAKVLRRYFVFKMEQEDPSNTLDKFLFTKANTILNLQNRKILSDSQVKLIFPPFDSNVKKADISKWDITLLFCLIRNLFQVSNSEKNCLDDIISEFQCEPELGWKDGELGGRPGHCTGRRGEGQPPGVGEKQEGGGSWKQKRWMREEQEVGREEGKPSNFQTVRLSDCHTFTGSDCYAVRLSNCMLDRWFDCQIITTVILSDCQIVRLFD